MFRAVPFHQNYWPTYNNKILFLAIEKLSKNNPINNLNLAFKTAEEKLGICKLLDPEDVYTENGIPDGKNHVNHVCKVSKRLVFF